MLQRSAYEEMRDEASKRCAQRLLRLQVKSSRGGQLKLQAPHRARVEVLAASPTLTLSLSLSLSELSALPAIARLQSHPDLAVMHIIAIVHCNVHRYLQGTDAC